MKRIFTFIATLLVIAFGMFSNRSLVSENINKSIEFAGGLEVLTRVESNQPNQEVNMVDVAKVVGKRIDIVGVKNPVIDVETGSNDQGQQIKKIRTTIAGVKNRASSSIIDLITSKGLITFHDTEDNFLAKGTDLLKTNGASLAFKEGQPIVSLQVKNKDLIKEITTSIKDKDKPQNKMVIWIDYDAKTDSFAKWNQLKISGQCTISKDKSVKKLCSKVISAASVNDVLSGDVIIEGGFTTTSARELASYINSGSFDYKMIIEETNQVPSSLGNNAFNQAIKASRIAILAVGIFMFLAYGLAGLISLFSLILYLFLVLSTFNWLGGEYGPDTIAALVIGFGMAADASIILFERFKDEIFRGRKTSIAFEKSSSKSLSSIFDANITTFIVAFILFQFGTRTVKGFAIMLTISIFWTMLVVVFLTRFNLGLLTKSSYLQNKAHWFGIKRKHIPKSYQLIPNYKGLWAKVNFIKPARKLMAISIIVIGLGLSMVGWRGTNNSIQFTGGTRISVVTNIDQKSSFKIDNVVNKISNDLSQKNINIEEKIVSFNNEKKYLLTFKTKQDISNDWSSMKSNFEQKYQNYQFGASSVSSSVARDAIINATKSVLWAILAIIGYVTIRFRWSYAIAAIIALIHDVLIVYGLFALFKIKISIAFISAILAIIGYSVNDTIVSFDRVREKMSAYDIRLVGKKELVQVANNSIRQTATRSLLTTITTLIAVLALLFFGPRSSTEFNIAILLGLLAGTYSSIWIAINIWIYLEYIRINKIKQKVTRAIIKIPGEPDESVFPGIND